MFQGLQKNKMKPNDRKQIDYPFLEENVTGRMKFRGDSLIHYELTQHY